MSRGEFSRGTGVVCQENNYYKAFARKTLLDTEYAAFINSAIDEQERG